MRWIILFLISVFILFINSSVIYAQWTNSTAIYLGNFPIPLRITSIADWNNQLEVGFFGTWENRTNLIWYCRENNKNKVFKLCWESMEFPSLIVSTIVVDLDRDGTLDIIVQCENEILYIINGKERNNPPIAIEKKYLPKFNASIPQMNLVNIFSNCGLPDIALIDKNNSLIIMRSLSKTYDEQCLGENSYIFEPLEFVYGIKGESEVIPLSIASDDIDGDCTPDLLYTLYLPKSNILEIYVYFAEKKEHKILMTLNSANKYGIPNFADINGDGAPDILLPICAFDNLSISFGECTQFNEIIIFYNNLQGQTSCSSNEGCCKGHPYEFNENNFKLFSFKENNTCGINQNINLPLTMTSSLLSPLILRFGDYNRDGYIDVLVPSTYGPLLLTSNNNYNNNGIQTLPFNCIPLDSSLLSPSFIGNNSAYINSIPFFAIISDTGRLDIVLTYHDEYQIIPISIYINHVASLEQNYFLAGSALNGVGNINAWGLFQPGAIHRFGWTDISMHQRWAYASQLSKTQAHALQFPRILFGLGRTFSYVQGYSIGILANQRGLHHQWSVSLVPNSNVFTWLSPLLSPKDWRIRLYIVSSTYEKLLLIVLGTSLTVIGAPIVFLKWREVRNDRREWKFR